MLACSSLSIILSFSLNVFHWLNWFHKWNQIQKSTQFHAIVDFNSITIRNQFLKYIQTHNFLFQQQQHNQFSIPFNKKNSKFWAACWMCVPRTPRMVEACILKVLHFSNNALRRYIFSPSLRHTSDAYFETVGRTSKIHKASN